ncbi:winged helix-turn-helix domain-containing protein [Escherichia sp. E2748]|uniref:winged helix-turn-helix domain-containing protein n=1 Tax=Escherichia sp. E2748 TaxID=2044460 RepID=UPI001082159E|nr:winged helix-turn-helix domain-containing protein [Escherichia sp. E2748]TGB97353.1 hypothetical protein CRI64_00235 [Escherichia sp. E2748]TLI80211.1 hypothetical protein FEK42_20820 [Escherichia sp. E2748]
MNDPIVKAQNRTNRGDTRLYNDSHKGAMVNMINAQERHATFQFGDFSFTDDGFLCCGAEEVYLPPKEAGVLKVLLANAKRVVSKHKIINDVWSSAVSDESLTRSIYRIRNALGQNKEKIFIETVYGKGYRFVIDVNTTVSDITKNSEYQTSCHAVQLMEEKRTLAGYEFAASDAVYYAASKTKRNCSQCDFLKELISALNSDFPLRE